jgi:hypothetical protein
MVAGFDMGRGGVATYYSRAISAPSHLEPSSQRPMRSGSADRAINIRLYRAAWLVVLVPLLLAAFTISRPVPLPRSAALLEPSFDAEAAARSATELATLYPDRSPGSPGAADAARWVARQLRALGLATEVDRFSADIPGKGTTSLVNVSATVPGRSLDTIVVAAHRDASSGDAGLGDNASGTAALIELARSAGSARTDASGALTPNYTLVFVSTDAGAYGLLGARELGRSATGGRTLAVISLDDLASSGSPRLEIAGKGPRSPAAQLVATLAARLSEEEGPEAETPSVVGQLLDLAFPFALTEQLELLGDGLPSVAIATDGNLPDAAVGQRLDTARLGQIGRATESAVASLDESLAPVEGLRAFVYASGRVIHGWAIGLVYIAMLIPFAVVLLDLLVRLRRRGIALWPALRSFLRRLVFWLWAGVLFWLFGLAGAWPDGEPAAISPDSQAADHWPRLALVVYLLALAASWLAARTRLVRRGPVADEDVVAGMAVPLAALGLVALVTVATNVYGLLFLLPSAHAWLLAIRWRTRSGWVRGITYAVGLLGPALLLGSLAFRFGIGLDAPWYLAELAAIGYVPGVASLLFLVWGAVAAQVLAAVTGRYAPYPAPPDRPARGLIGSAVYSLRQRRSAVGAPDRVGNA